MDRRSFLTSAGGAALAASVSGVAAQVFPPSEWRGPKLMTSTTERLRAAAPGNWYADMPRGSFGHVRVGDEIFFLGGHTGQFHCYLSSLFTNQFLAYNFRTRKWRKLRDYPFPVQSPNLVNEGSAIFAFGGYRYDEAFHFVGCDVDANGNTAQQRDTYSARSDDQIFRFDLKTGRWERYGNMPHRRSSALAFAAGGKIYLVAGWDGTPSKRGDNKGRFHPGVDVLDVSSGKFIPYDPVLSRLRRALAGAVVNGKLVLAGGLSDQGMAMTDVSLFDPANGKFSDLAPLNESRFAPGACFTGKWLVVAGGLDFKTGLLNKISFAPPDGSAWTDNKISLDQPSMFVELEAIDDSTVLALGAFAGDSPYPLLQEIKIG